MIYLYLFSCLVLSCALFPCLCSYLVVPLTIFLILVCLFSSWLCLLVFNLIFLFCFLLSYYHVVGFSFVVFLWLCCLLPYFDIPFSFLSCFFITLYLFWVWLTFTTCLCFVLHLTLMRLLPKMRETSTGLISLFTLENDCVKMFK